MSTRLKGKKVAFLATDGFEQVELTQPWDAVKDAGGECVLVSIKEGSIQGFNHFEKGDNFTVDKTIEQTSSSDFDGLVLPGGVHNPDALRTDELAIAFIQGFFKQHKPVSAICHGPWTLVEADVLKNRTVTSWPSLKTDIINAGGNWVDREVFVDNGLVTSRKPEDLDAFCAKTVEELCEGKHLRQTA